MLSKSKRVKVQYNCVTKRIAKGYVPSKNNQ